MKVSINVTNYSWRDGRDVAEALADTALLAERAGLDTFWVSDHMLQSDPTAGPDEREMLEAYTTLAYVAAVTSRIRVGAMVTPVTYRAPALLLKAVTTIDVLSRGRAWLGLGAGYPGEAAELGLPMPATGRRFDQVERVLKLAEQVWGGDGSASGWAPRPVRGRVPILLGGMGERRTLPLAARYADACNLFDIPDEGRTVRHKLEVLDEQCRATGRDPSSIERSISTRLERGEDADGFAEQLARLRGYGLDHAVVITPGPWQAAAVEVVGQAADRVRDRR